MLLAAGEIDAMAVGAPATARLPGLGETSIRIAGRSALGSHCEFVRPAPDFTAAVCARLTALREADRTRIDHVVAAAAEVSRAFEAAIEARRLRREDLFDNDYVQIPRHQPGAVLDALSEGARGHPAAIQEKWLAVDKQMTFCARSTQCLSARPQPHLFPPPTVRRSRLERRHCRNKRVFDDRAGLSAARNARPFLRPVLRPRHGNGVTSS